MTQTCKDPICARICIVDIYDFNFDCIILILIRYITIDTRSNDK